MDTPEIQRILDGLDRRLALGEIDLATYNTLKAKFAVQLQTSDVGTPLESTVEAMRSEAVALKCPGCMAVLPASADRTQGSVTCEYCGGTFALQTAADEMARLRQDVRKWITEVAGHGGTGGADEASRTFIFRNNIWPHLKVTAERATELYHSTRYLPLFAFPLLGRLGGSPFHDALALTPDLTSLVERLKNVVAQVEAPELSPFAVGEREKNDLHTLGVSCMEVAYLSNIRHNVATFTPDGFNRARANLKALGELYSSASRMAATLDPSYAKFMRALQTRIGGVDKATELLAGLLSPSEGVLVDRVTSELDTAAQMCAAAATEVEAAGREPKEGAPAIEGTRSDAQVIRMLADCTRLFGQCGAAESGESFGAFQTTLDKAVAFAAPSSADVAWLDVFLANLSRHVGAVNGEVEVPVVVDYGWIDAAATGGVRSSLFGGKETFDIQDRLLVPFWLAAIHFSEQSGAWFWKKGQAAEGIMLMEAARHGGQCFIEPGDSWLVPMCQQAVESPRAIGGFAPAVAPVVGADAANRCMRSAVSNSDRFRGSYTRMVGVIYLPAVVVRYSSKKAERHAALLPGAEVRTIDLAVRRLRLGGRDLLLAS